MEHPTYTVRDFQYKTKWLNRMLKALISPNGLPIQQRWEVLLMVAKELRKLADLIEDQVGKAKDLEEYQRNGG